MSWIDKIQTEFKITCGDGNSYSPLWLNATKAVEYNVSFFEFPELDGTLVRRSRPKGFRYQIEIYFQGENHLETADAFEASARNPAAWTIEHPFYGSILVQPLGLIFDNSVYNVTKITGTIAQTITEDAPKARIHAEDKIAEMKTLTDTQLAVSYSIDVPAPRVVDTLEMKKNTLSTYTEGVKKVLNSIDSEKYFNAFNNANSYINNAISDPLNAMRQIQAMLSMPSQFADTIKNRLNMLIRQFDLLRTSVGSIFSKASKKLFENNGGTVIGAMALATVTNATYTTRNDALVAVELLLDSYNNYLTDLDTLQTDNGGTPDSFIPDGASLQLLGELVSLAVSNLFVVASGSKQERVLYLEDDTNLILLAHRLYKLKSDDSTIEELKVANDIRFQENLQLRKGRKIVYYV